MFLLFCKQCKTERMDLMLSRSNLRQSNQRPTSRTEQLAKECALLLIAPKRFHSSLISHFEKTHNVQDMKVLLKIHIGHFSLFSYVFQTYSLLHKSQQQYIWVYSLKGCVQPKHKQPYSYV